MRCTAILKYLQENFNWFTGIASQSLLETLLGISKYEKFGIYFRNLNDHMIAIEFLEELYDREFIVNVYYDSTYSRGVFDTLTEMIRLGSISVLNQKKWAIKRELIVDTIRAMSKPSVCLLCFRSSSTECRHTAPMLSSCLRYVPK